MQCKINIRKQILFYTQIEMTGVQRKFWNPGDLSPFILNISLTGGLCSLLLLCPGPVWDCSPEWAFLFYRPELLFHGQLWTWGVENTQVSKTFLSVELKSYFQSVLLSDKGEMFLSQIWVGKILIYWAEDEMVGQHHWPNGHEFEQTPGDI